MPRRSFLSRSLLAMLWLSGADRARADAPPISKVVVLDEHFAVIGEVCLPIQLLEFRDAWSARKRTERMSSDVDLKTFKYKLDVRSDERATSGRWLYRPDGLLTKLDHAKKPVYEILDAKVFNALLGIGGK